MHEPIVEVGQAFALPCLFPVADRDAVHPDIQPVWLGAAAHAYQLSFFSLGATGGGLAVLFAMVPAVLPVMGEA